MTQKMAAMGYLQTAPKPAEAVPKMPPGVQHPQHDETTTGGGGYPYEWPNAQYGVPHFHATVIHSVKKINNQIKLYPDIQYDINQISLILFEIRENNNNLIPKDINLLLLTINHTNSFIKTI